MTVVFSVVAVFSSSLTNRTSVWFAKVFWLSALNKVSPKPTIMLAVNGLICEVKVLDQILSNDSEQLKAKID